MINKRPLLSIVIPTKDRYCYLKKLTELIDSFQSDEIELVLQDNTADNTEIIEFLKQKDYSYIRYAHKSEQIPISLNSDLAILNSTGEYVCFIGDDDGVTRYIVDCVKWMKKNDVEAVFNKDSHFFWNTKAKYIKKRKVFVKHNPQKELDILLKKGFVLTLSNVPRLYHGIVKRTKIDEIYSIGNTFFPALTPDIASAVSLSFVIDKYYEINAPIIINGTSEMTGGGVLKKGGVVYLSDIPFMGEKEKESWEEEVPPIWSGNYAWANSGIKALRYMGRADLIDIVNRDYYLAYPIALRPRKKILIKYAFAYSKTPINLFFLIIRLLILKYLMKFKNLNKTSVLYDMKVRTIIDAEAFFVNNSQNPFELVNDENKELYKKE